MGLWEFEIYTKGDKHGGYNNVQKQQVRCEI